MNPTAMPGAIQTALVMLVLLAAYFDARFRRIPNWLSGAGFILGFALQTSLHGWQGLGTAVLGASAAFSVYFVLFALRAMGAGDVKLMTAIGAIAGPANWLIIFILTSGVGGLLAVILVLAKGKLFSTLRNVALLLRQLLRLRPPYRTHRQFDVADASALKLPHAIPIAIGCLLFLVLFRA